MAPVRRRFGKRSPIFEGEETDEGDAHETSFSSLWSEMEEDGFVVDGSRVEEEEVRALYAEVCAALDRQKAQVTPEAVFEAVEEVAGGFPLSPERHAQAIYAAEWYAGQAFPGRRRSLPEPRGFPGRDRRLSRRNWTVAMLRDGGVEEPLQDPTEFTIFPSPEEVEDALRLSVPPVTVSEVYGAISVLHRTFRVFPDFPTLVERLRQDPAVLRAGYAPIWYVWRTVTDLHLVIRDRMQEVLDAAGR